MHYDEYKKYLIGLSVQKDQESAKELKELSLLYFEKIKLEYRIDEETTDQLGDFAIKICGLEFSVKSNYIHFCGTIQNLTSFTAFPYYLYVFKIKNKEDLGFFLKQYDELQDSIKLKTEILNEAYLMDQMVGRKSAWWRFWE